MEWYLILLVVIGCLLVLTLILLFVVANFLFNKSFTRLKESSMDLFNKLDSNADSDWKPFIEELKTNNKVMKELHLEDIYITSFDGLKLHANLFPSVNPSNDFVIAVHGYHGNRFQDYTYNQKFLHENYNILFIDLRGHCESEGKYITFGVYDNLDLVDWTKYLHNRFGQDINLFVHGVSMGAATCMMAADKMENVQGIVADCGFTSGYEIMRSVGKALAGKISNLELPILRLVVKIRGHYDLKKEDTRNTLKNTKIPVLFIHGKTDTFVPYFMSEENYKACSSKKKFISYENTGHALNSLKHHDDYKVQVLNFFEENKKRQ